LVQVFGYVPLSIVCRVRPYQRPGRCYRLCLVFFTGFPKNLFARVICGLARRLRRAALGVVIWLAFGILTANAQNVYTWTGNDGVNRWTKKKNWLNGALPIPGVNTWLVFAGN